MFQVAILLLVLVTTVNAGWKPDPPPVNDGLPDFDSDPIVIQARKMAKLMINQDAVSTCRYILFKEPRVFHEAKDECENLIWPLTNHGVGMATIQNEHENEDVRRLIQLAFGHDFDRSKPYKYGQWALIGLSRRKNNDRKLLPEEKGVVVLDEWYYQNGHVAKFSNFHREMPDQQSKGKAKKGTLEYQNWVQVNKKGYWDDTYSSKALPYTCEFCGKYIVLSKHVTWDAAKEHCEDVGLQFAVVNSDEDNAELLFAANVALGEELGGRRFNNTNWVWIGEKEVMENGQGTEKWTHWNGEEIGFKPKWDKKYQPDNWTIPKRGEQNVVAFSRKDGKWDDSFASKKRPFACMCPEQSCTYN